MRDRVQERVFRVERARLTLQSLLMLFTIVGFCAGVLSGLLVAVFAGDLSSFITTLVLAPIISALNGAFAALIGYPLYTWITNRYFSQSLVGFAAASEGDEST